MIVYMRKLKQKIERLKWIKFEESKLRSGVLVQRERAVKRDQIEVKMSTTYVDDIFMISSTIEKGWRYCKIRKMMVWSKESEKEDENVLGDVRTALIMKELANDLDPDIKMKIDTPSLNQTGRLPVLDLEVWMTYENGIARIKHKFYEKPMASGYVIHKNSALSWKTKKNALVGEVRRRILNTSYDVFDIEGPEMMDKLCYKMLKSGYNQWERNIIISEGMSCVANIKEKVENGERPLYRMGEWKKLERGIQKIRKGKSWYGKSTETVLFVQATPNEELRKQVQLEADKSGLKIKVCEKGGRTIRSLLQRSDVLPQMSCGDTECVVCNTKEEGKCRKENCGYKIYCKACKINPDTDGKIVPAEMHGETSRSAKVRCKEHYNALKKKKNSNLYEHLIEMHGGDESIEFGYEVTGVFVKDVLGRQLDEARRIERFGGTRLNDKEEWVQPASVTVGAYRSQF